MTTMMKETHKKTTRKRVSAHEDPFADDGARAGATSSGRASEYEDVAGEGGTTLEQTPTRMVSLLRGIGMIKPVREVLRSIGYTADEHARGWALLQRCSGFVEGEAEPVGAHDLSGDPAAIAAEQVARLREAHAFYEEWSTITRTVVSRRDLLVQLGLVRRKVPARKAGKRTAPRGHAPMSA